jgi:hypothetical protein
MAHKLVQLDRTFLDVPEEDDELDPAGISALTWALRQLSLASSKTATVVSSISATT